jgi:CheY-like chemotaxis protein
MATEGTVTAQGLVLIAEDEEPIAEVVATVVEDAGYTPRLAAHGREALELARAEQPALLITDLMMPYLSGAELIAALRSDAAASGHDPVPVIVITAAGLAQARAAGANAVLRKPFELLELDALLRRFLEAHAG